MPGEDASTKSGAQQLASDLNDRFRDAGETVRKRADTTAKALIALGTTVLTAVGIAKFSDVFPSPPGSGKPWDQGVVWATVILIASFVAMAFTVVFFTIRLWRVSETLVMSSDPDEITGLRDGERPLVDLVYKQVSDAENVQSLAAYEARADRFDRIADQTEGAEAERLSNEATLIRTEVVTTLGRAGLVVLRQRTANAIKGKLAVSVYILFLAAIIGFGLSSDWLDSARAGETKVATDCAAAEKGGAKVTPPICKQYLTSTTPSETPDPEAEVDKARDDISKALTACRAAARKATPRNLKACVPLERALAAAQG
jgi:hypothetical protein